MKLPSPTLRSGTPLFAALCLALIFTLAFLGKAPAASPGTSPGHAETSGQAAISKTEWASYLQQNAFLRDADAKLNATYRKITSGLSPADKKSLIAEQRAWIRQRNNEAFERHPKGSAEYCRFLAGETLKREVTLAERYLSAPLDAAAESPAQTGQTPASPTPATPAPVRRPEPAPSAAKPEAPAAEPRPGVPEQSLPPAQRPAPAMTGKTPAPEEKTPGSAPKPAREENSGKPRDLVTIIPPTKPTPRSRAIDITPILFARKYNTLAQSFQTPPFPLTPTSVSGGGTVRTEQYQVSDDISLQFKYTGGNFEKPEIITFMARQFMNGLPSNKDNIAYALVCVLKTLNKDTPQNPEAKDAEIFGFLRSINNAFTSDASRVWKNDGLVYVITYMQKSDLFAMVITRDGGRK